MKGLRNIRCTPLRALATVTASPGMYYLVMEYVASVHQISNPFDQFLEFRLVFNALLEFVHDRVAEAEGRVHVLDREHHRQGLGREEAMVQWSASCAQRSLREDTRGQCQPYCVTRRVPGFGVSTTPILPEIGKRVNLGRVAFVPSVCQMSLLEAGRNVQ